MSNKKMGEGVRGFKHKAKVRWTREGVLFEAICTVQASP